MPHNVRIKIRQQAKIMRETGETIVLYISNEDRSDDATPLSIILSEQPPDLSLDTRVAIYASLDWTVSESTNYSVGGRVKNRKCTIEASIESMDLLSACRAIKVADGTMLRKLTERISADQVSYIVTCEGYLGVVN